MFKKTIQFVTKHKVVIIASIVLVIGITMYFSTDIIEAFSNRKVKRRNDRILNKYIRRSKMGNNKTAVENSKSFIAKIRKDLSEKGVEEPDIRIAVRRAKDMRSFGENRFFQNTSNEDFKRTNWRNADNDQRLAIVAAEAMVLVAESMNKKCKECAKLDSKQCKDLAAQKL